ncbi:MAG: outer membrane protein assembly factor BamB [Natronomonas sp.]|jgi:outer membrane protein assembly factor BamB
MVPDAPSTSRRSVLRSGLLAAVGLAGCVDRQGNGTPSEGDNEPPTGDAVRWTYQTGGSVRHRPTLQDGFVYAGGGTNDRATSDRDHVRPETSENVYALSADDGSEQWRYEAPAGVASAPVAREGVFVVVGWSAGTHGRGQRLVRIDDGSETWTTEARDSFLHLLYNTGETVYLGTSDDELGTEGEQLIAVRTSGGGQRWAVEAGDTTDAAVFSDTLYAVEGSRRTTAIAVNDGSERWHRDMRPATDEPRVFGDAMYLRSEQQNENGNYPVVAVNAGDGSDRWRFSVPVDEPFVPTGAVESGDTVYVTEYDGWLFGVDRAGGSENWRYSTDGDTRDQPVVVDDTVYLASNTGSVHAVDAATGDRQWKRTVPGNARLAAGNPQGVVVRGGKDEGEEYLRAYTPDGTERWSFSYAGNLTKPAVDGTRAIVGTGSGYVAALAEQ